jgi:hypothetical protein
MKTERSLSMKFLTCQFSFWLVDSILKDDLDIRQIAPKLLPCRLSKEWMENWVTISQELQGGLERASEFFLKIITGDEMWACGYDPETMWQLSQWKSPSSPHLKKARQVCSDVKSMPTVLLDIQGVVHYVPHGQPINQHYTYTRTHARSGPNCWTLHHDL